MCCTQSSENIPFMLFTFVWIFKLSGVQMKSMGKDERKLSASRCPGCSAAAAAAASRDEAVLLASSQRPADCSHVSACLWVTAARCLHPHSFPPPLLFSLSFARRLTHAALWLAIPPVSTPLCKHSFSLLHKGVFHLPLTVDLCVQRLLFLTPMETLKPGWLWLMRNATLSASHEWEAGNAHQSFIISPPEINPTNHPSSKPLSEPNWSHSVT